MKLIQQTKALEVKNFSPTYRALGDYDIKKLYVEKESLDERGLKPEDLMEIMIPETCKKAGAAKKQSSRALARGSPQGRRLPALGPVRKPEGRRRDVAVGGAHGLSVI